MIVEKPLATCGCRKFQLDPLAQQVVKSRGHHCGDVELTGYLTNAAGPVSLVLDLRIAHHRVGSSTDPTLNGHLKYPNN